MPSSSSTTSTTTILSTTVQSSSTGSSKLRMRMGEDLPIINFSTNKYVDAKTLSRIRSHAQQRVQDQRLARRTKLEEEGDVSGDSSSAARTSRDVVRRGGSGGQQSFTFVFEQQSGEQRVATSAGKANKKKPAAKRKKKVVVKEEPEGDTVFFAVKRECHSLSASPSERPDPFGAFPVAVDGVFLELAENYLHNWKWQHSKNVLFQATLAHPVLVHSFLTVAYKVCRNDEYRCLFHENMTLSYIGKGIHQLHTLKGSDREALACALTWSIIRLATVKVIEQPPFNVEDSAKHLWRQINEGQLETSINHLNALALISPDMTVWEGHMFGQHFQTSTASLLLANYTQSARIQNSLHLPFGPMTTPAIHDVEALNYILPENSILHSLTLQSFLHPSVADALLALTALYNLSSSPVTSLPHTHTGPQAREAVKISLRLARGSSSSSEAPHDNSWHFQFAECARLTGLLFTWSFGRNVDSHKNDSIASARRHNRAFLTPILIECLLEEAGGNRAVYDFLLWMFIVCGSTTTMHEDRAYFAGLVRGFYPDCGRWEVGHVRGLGYVLPWIEIEDGEGGEMPWEVFWGEVVDPTGVVAKGSGDGERAPLLLGYVGVTPGLREHLRRRAMMGGRVEGEEEE